MGRPSPREESNDMGTEKLGKGQRTGKVKKRGRTNGAKKGKGMIWGRGNLREILSRVGRVFEN